MSIRVEVVYALAQSQDRTALEMPDGATAMDAVRASGLLREAPGGSKTRIGVWGRTVAPELRLRDGDRVEIYRPLIADPKQVRRERAARRSKPTTTV